MYWTTRDVRWLQRPRVTWIRNNQEFTHPWRERRVFILEIQRKRPCTRRLGVVYIVSSNATTGKVQSRLEQVAKVKSVFGSQVYLIHARDISMKLLQPGTSSSLKSRKFVKGGNQESIVRLRFRRLFVATVEDERLVRADRAGGVGVSWTIMIGSDASSSSLMFMKFCCLETWFADSERPSKQARAADRLLRFTSDLTDSDLAEGAREKAVGRLALEGGVGMCGRLDDGAGFGDGS